MFVCLKYYTIYIYLFVYLFLYVAAAGILSAFSEDMVTCLQTGEWLLLPQHAAHILFWHCLWKMGQFSNVYCTTTLCLVKDYSRPGLQPDSVRSLSKLSKSQNNV